jgi:hypothetical protein
MNLTSLNPFGRWTSAAKVQLLTLKKWNIALAVIYAVQAIALLLLAVARPLPLQSTFLAKDELASGASGETVLAQAVHVLFTVNLVYVVAAFLLVAAVIHALAASKYRNRYEAGLKTGANGGRWVATAVVSGLMALSLSLAVGVYDIATLADTAGLAMASPMLLFVTSLAKNNNRQLRHIALWLAWLTALAAWLVPVASLLGAAAFGVGPSVMIYLAAVALGLWLGGLVLATQLFLTNKGWWADGSQRELGVMVIGLVAKTALAWLLYAGVLRP